MASQKNNINLTLVSWEKASLLYGTDEEKEKVRNTISEVVTLVMGSSNSKKGLSSLFIELNK